MVALVLFAGLLVGNWLGYELRAEPEAVTVVWPPSGLLLGALLLSEPRRWRLFLSLSVAAEVVAAALATWSLPEATMALPFALLNTGEALLAAALLRRVRPGLSFGRAGDLALFAAVGAGLAPLISGIAAGGLLVWQYEGLAWFAEAEKWALGNAVGVLVFAPPTVLWVTRPPRWTSSRRLVEGTIATVGMGATLLLVDRAGAGSVDHVFDLPVFLVPFLLFGAVRFGPRGVAAMAVAAVLLLVELMLVGGGLASRSITSHTQTVAVQAFLYVSVLTTYLLAATTVERQTAEDEADARMRAERRLRAVTERIEDVVWSLDGDGRITYVSPSIERLLGVPPEDRIGRRPHEADFTPASRETVQQHLARAYRGEIDTLTFEAEYLRADESGVWAEINAKVTRDASGGVVTIDGVSRDISERRRIEAALREAERRFRELSERGSDVFYEMDGFGRFSFVSSNIGGQVELSPEALVGTRITSVLTPESAPVAEDALRRLREGEVDEITRELEAPGLGGRTVWYEVNAVVVRDQKGRFERILGVSRDVTRRYEAERALEASEHRFRTFADRVNDILWTAGPDARFQYVSPGLRTMLGFEPSDCIGKRFDELPLSPEALAETRKHVGAAIEGRPEFVFEAPHHHRDGSELWLELSGVVVKNEGGRVEAIHGVSRDVTERRKAQQRLREQRHSLRERAAELVAANAELDAFTHTVSHDLGAPLRVLRSRTDELLRDGQAGEAAREYAVGVQRIVKRMSSLIEDLMELSQSARQDLKPELVDVSVLAAETAEDLRAAFPSHDVYLSVDPGIYVWADRRCMRIVIANLLDNAWKYTSRRESPRVDVTSEPEPAPGRVAFSVGDNGIGFDSQGVGRAVFLPFQRFDGSAFGGHGIGLATADRLTRRNDGRLSVESSEGSGARFTVEMPGPAP